MKRATAEERALARANIYRLLAMSFSYPTPEVWGGLRPALEGATVGAELIDEATLLGVGAVAEALGSMSRESAEAAYQGIFTLSYNEDCPPYETAFSASHLFQQTHHLADIAAFYKAFGVKSENERPDHLTLELEFCYLLTLKEAQARERGESEHFQVCRYAQRLFLKEHLARWAPVIGQRVAVTGAGSPYATVGRLLATFVAAEERYLRLGTIERYRDEPAVIADEPGDMSCPVAEGALASLFEQEAADVGS